jgi:hypothetical protein
MNQSSTTKAMSNSMLASGPIQQQRHLFHLGKYGDCYRRKQGKQCHNAQNADQAAPSLRN